MALLTITGIGINKRTLSVKTSDDKKQNNRTYTKKANI